MREKDFSIAVGGRGHHLNRANTTIYLFRRPEHQDIDYLEIINDEEEERLSVFRNPELCRLMAGIAFKGTGAPYLPKFENRDTFEDRYGWFADTIIQDEADEDTIAAYAHVSLNADIDEDGSWELDD